MSVPNGQWQGRILPAGYLGNKRTGYNSTPHELGMLVSPLFLVSDVRVTGVLVSFFVFRLMCDPLRFLCVFLNLFLLSFFFPVQKNSLKCLFSFFVLFHPLPRVLEVSYCDPGLGYNDYK